MTHEWTNQVSSVNVPEQHPKRDRPPNRGGRNWIWLLLIAVVIVAAWWAISASTSGKPRTANPGERTLATQNGNVELVSIPQLLANPAAYEGHAIVVPRAVIQNENRNQLVVAPAPVNQNAQQNQSSSSQSVVVDLPTGTPSAQLQKGTQVKITGTVVNAKNSATNSSERNTGIRLQASAVTPLAGQNNQPATP